MSAADIFRVGVTGGIGSGKSTVADRFVSLGATLIDTDAIAHRLTAPGGAAIAPIRERFGAAMIAADGRLDRAAMRAHVFSHPEARQTLEAILHPMIRSVSRQEVAAAARAGADYALLAIPLLVESGRSRHGIERVLVVDCPEEVQVARVMKRSGLARMMASTSSRAGEPRTAAGGGGRRDRQRRRRGAARYAGTASARGLCGARQAVER